MGKTKVSKKKLGKSYPVRLTLNILREVYLKDQE